MKTLSACAVALAWLCCSAYSAEQGRSGNTLLSSCKAVMEDRNYHSVMEGVYMGTVYGIAYMLRPVYRGAVCADIPAAANTVQLVRVVVRYMEMHPKDLHYELADLAVLALKEAWPCKDKP